MSVGDRPTFAVPWTDHVNSDPHADLKAACEGLICKPVIVMSSATASHMLRSYAWEKIIKTAPGLLPVFSIEDAASLLGVKITIDDNLESGRVVIGGGRVIFAEAMA